ncbi:TetR/AcrR family transcriptional regulator [uncultured Sneathiella sp.]|uniref:TetR/AcrR family transcriptional regulator n=1 Tax=uncultured Sneathiella sp. TaxID=879315 RepID=UPI0030ECA330|tara:strand:+ start:52185 stop:52829 length:645 start_codon:yes stop_codon:yes gene_type:complete
MNPATAADRPRKNPERRQESSQRIIEAATELFAEKGYQRTTLIEIGRRAGCTGTLVSNRFGSKERVLRAVLAQILNRFETDETWHPRAREIDSLPAPAQLSRFVATYLKDVARRGTRIRALYVLMGEGLGSLPGMAEEIAHVNRVFRSDIKSYLILGKERGELPSSLDPSILATLIVGLLRGVAMQILAEPEDMPLNALITASQKSVTSMILAK